MDELYFRLNYTISYIWLPIYYILIFSIEHHYITPPVRFLCSSLALMNPSLLSKPKTVSLVPVYHLTHLSTLLALAWTGAFETAMTKASNLWTQFQSYSESEWALIFLDDQVLQQDCLPVQPDLGVIPALFTSSVIPLPHLNNLFDI